MIISDDSKNSSGKNENLKAQEIEYDKTFDNKFENSIRPKMFDEYIEYSVWFLLFAAYLLVGYFFYKIIKNINRSQ